MTITKKGLLAAVFAAFILILTLDVVYEVNFTRLNKLELHTGKLPKGARLGILQITDLHGKYNLNGRITSLAAKADADVIVITGDLIDAHTVDFSGAYALVSSLQSLNKPIYYVPGNHEWRNGRLKELVKGLGAKGVRVLQNKNDVAAINGVKINICGVDDVYTKHDKIEGAAKGIDESNYSVLLSHSPRIIDRLRGNNPDLVLSGHTHGGQIRLPVIGAVIAPGEGFFPKLDKGLFKLDEGKYLYVDSGSGTSIIPVRFLDRSQVSLITVTNP